MSALFRRQRHSDRVTYIIFVLWLIGHPERAIAAAAGLRRKQVAGVIQNSEYRNRAGMSNAERQAKLDELAAIRVDEASGALLDAGALNRIPFKILPLSSRQARGPLRRRLQRHG